MSKKFNLFGIAAALMLVVFLAGCNQTKSPTEAITADTAISLSKAGNGNTDPRSFDEYGMQCETGEPMELWMGVGNEDAGTLVGYVTFDGSNVIIDLTDVDGDGNLDMFPYVVEEVHIHFADDVDGIPHTKKGNPIPGQFEYNVSVDPYQSEIIAENVIGQFDAVGAIHLSVVKYGGVEGFGFYLTDDPVQMRVTYPYTGAPSYFQVYIQGAGFLDGQYDGWCIDTDNVIYQNTWYTSHLYSSYEDLPAGIVEHPENFDLVNYLVNNFETGQVVQPLDASCNPVGSPQALTYGDIQRAIWQLIDNQQSTSGLGPWSQSRVNAILCDVNANGGGFEPGCEQKIVFLVVPDGGNVQLVVGQPTISSIEVPCYTMGGTAWGDGKLGANFPGANQWGTWFEYGCDD